MICIVAGNIEKFSGQLSRSILLSNRGREQASIPSDLGETRVSTFVPLLNSDQIGQLPERAREFVEYRKSVDIRTTPVFDGEAASRLLQDLVAQVDHAWSGTRPTLIQVDTRWPAYVLPDDSRLRTAIVDAARMVGVEVEAKVAGPSSIGNYLAGLNIPATAGFGVSYIGLHGTDERIRIDTIPTVQAIYHATVRTLLSAYPKSTTG